MAKGPGWSPGLSSWSLLLLEVFADFLERSICAGHVAVKRGRMGELLPRAVRRRGAIAKKSHDHREQIL